MKRIVFSIIAISGIALISCKKTTDPVTPAEPGLCTVTGNVLAPLDLSNDTTDAGVFTSGLHNENVTNVGMTFVVDSKNLDHNPDASYDYQDLTYSTTVTDGVFSIQLPAISTPYTVDVYLDEFNADQRQYTPGEVNFENKLFSVGAMTVGNITNGATRVVNFNYSF